MPQVDVNAIVKEVKMGAIEVTTAFTPQKIFFEIGAMVFIWINGILAARKASIETAKLDRFQYETFINDVARKAWIAPDEVGDRGGVAKKHVKNVNASANENVGGPPSANSAAEALPATSAMETLPIGSAMETLPATSAMETPPATSVAETPPANSAAELDLQPNLNTNTNRKNTKP
jgi:hypothetical protein